MPPPAAYQPSCSRKAARPMRLRTLSGVSDAETRPLGGVLQVTVVGIGCNNFGRRLDAAGAATVVHAALDEGITFFDTADIYGEGKSEEMLGAALKGRRESAVIASDRRAHV